MKDYVQHAKEGGLLVVFDTSEGFVCRYYIKYRVTNASSTFFRLNYQIT